jgi:organic hydroperoxide reductase OsmC/OhrA
MMEDAPPSGFRTVRLEIRITGGDRERLEDVLGQALRGCPGIRTLQDPVALDVQLDVS